MEPWPECGSTETDAGYASVEDSADGNYYTVDFGSQ
jgi:hypothetical protein